MTNMEARILDKNFVVIEIIDYYTSFNWDKTRTGDGGCELYVPASKSVKKILETAKYIAREDDDMTCQIQNVQLTTSAESGEQFVISATDITKAFLNKRIMWNDMIFTGTINQFFKKILEENFGEKCADSKRQILAEDGTPLIIFVDQSIGLIGLDGINWQTSHDNIGDLFANVAITYGYGLKLVYLAGHLYLRLTKGTDRSNYLVFSEDYDNLVSTNYANENSNVSNVILVGGEKLSDETQRVQDVGEAEGIDREERFVDYSDLTSSIDWVSLCNMFYPISTGTTIVPPKQSSDVEEKGYIIESDGYYYYFLTKFSIAIQDANHFNRLKETFYMYKWTIETYEQSAFFTLYNCPVALLPRDLIADPPVCTTVIDDQEVEIDPSTITDWDNVTIEEVSCNILPVLYYAMMMAKGYEELLSYTATSEFSAEIEANGLYSYKTDYDIGDYIGVENAFGTFAVLMIDSISETCDPTGYHLDVKLTSRSGKETSLVTYLATDDSEFLLTDDGDFIII